MNMPPFTQYKQWMIERYGEPLFRIPVEIASSCPHGRCAFCSENGSRAQQTQKQDSPREQAEEAIRFATRRYRAKKFMLYIQAFSADLTNPAQQAIILDLLERFEFTAISIGTRPDCLPEEALEFLQTLVKKRRRGFQPRSDQPTASAHANEAGSLVYDNIPLEVWVELGVQTANNKTLKRINRGHDWKCSRKAIIELAERGIPVAPHVILGLPGEQSDDWNRTTEELAKLPISGIKIHNLHILKETELAEQYAAKPFPLLNHWEYAEGLMDFLRRTPADIPVMRISTDTPDDQLIAPHWHLEKGQFLDYVIQQMTMREIRQGDLFQPLEKPAENVPKLVKTDDGSITFFSEDWKEYYHTKAGARLEAEKKFIEPSGLKARLQQGDVALLDVCFGLGNNSLAALCEAGISACHCAGRDACATGKLDITALEMDKRVVRAAAESFQPLETDPMNWNEVLKKLLEGPAVFPNLGKIDLRFGDARCLIQRIEDNVFDVIFHDPFSSQHCPELWTVEFFKQLHRVMKPDGVLCTYSSAAPVRGAMLEAGFYIAETVPGQQMGTGSIAALQKETIEPFKLIETIEPRRAIPYRDEHLCATSKAILRQRQDAVESFQA